jgi:hypothetical protein
MMWTIWLRVELEELKTNYGKKWFGSGRPWIRSSGDLRIWWNCMELMFLNMLGMFEIGLKVCILVCLEFFYYVQNRSCWNRKGDSKFQGF